MLSLKKDLMERFDTHMSKAHESLRATREATEKHAKDRQNATDKLFDRMHETETSLMRGMRKCEESLEAAMNVCPGLSCDIETLEEKLRECQFGLKQLASTNSVLALEGELSALKKRMTWLEKKCTTSTASEEAKAMHLNDHCIERSRLRAAAPVVLTRGRSLDARQDQQQGQAHTIAERIGYAQQQARAREYSRSLSQDRGAFIGSEQNKSVVIEALDKL